MHIKIEMKAKLFCPECSSDNVSFTKEGPIDHIVGCKTCGYELGPYKHVKAQVHAQVIEQIKDCPITLEATD